MISKFLKYDNTDKIYQILCSDEMFELYVAFKNKDINNEPVKYLLLYDRKNSSGDAKAIIGSKKGFVPGKVNNYLFFNSSENNNFKESIISVILEHSQNLEQKLLELLTSSLNKRIK